MKKKQTTMLKNNLKHSKLVDIINHTQLYLPEWEIHQSTENKGAPKSNKKRVTHPL